MPEPKEIRTYDGDKFELQGQSVAEYVAWRDAMLRQTGEVLAAKMPKFFGKVEFNIQNGKFVNWNMKISGK
jgi:hypothetical protein